MTGAAEARVGISGWVYPNWRGEFYPKGLRQADELEFASRREITIVIGTPPAAIPTYDWGTEQ